MIADTEPIPEKEPESLARKLETKGLLFSLVPPSTAPGAFPKMKKRECALRLTADLRTAKNGSRVPVAGVSLLVSTEDDTVSISGLEIPLNHSSIPSAWREVSVDDLMRSNKNAVASVIGHAILKGLEKATA